MFPMRFLRPRRLDRRRDYAKLARLSIEQRARLRNNIPVVTHHHGATCASARLLRVVMHRCDGPRDRPIALVGFSIQRTRRAQLAVAIVPPRNRDVYKAARMMPPFAMVRSVDIECPAACLNSKPRHVPGLLWPAPRTVVEPPRPEQLHRPGR